MFQVELVFFQVFDLKKKKKKHLLDKIILTSYSFWQHLIKHFWSLVKLTIKIYLKCRHAERKPHTKSNVLKLKWESGWSLPSLKGLYSAQPGASFSTCRQHSHAPSCQNWGWNLAKMVGLSLISARELSLGNHLFCTAAKGDLSLMLKCMVKSNITEIIACCLKYTQATHHTAIPFT